MQPVFAAWLDWPAQAEVRWVWLPPPGSHMKTKYVVLLALLAALAIGVWWWTRRAEPARTSGILHHPSAAAEAAPVELEPIPEAEARSARSAAHPALVPVSIGSRAADETALLRVRVIDKSDGGSIPDASVMATHASNEFSRRIEPAHGARGKPFQDIRTDTEGRVEIEVPTGIAIRVRAQGSTREAGSDESAVAALEPGAVRSLTLQLRRIADLPFWLKLIDESTRVPIAGAVVEGRSSAGSNPDHRSDAQGLISYTARSWQPESILVRAPGYGETYITPRSSHATAETARVIALARSAALHVHVCDSSGASIRKARILLETPASNLDSSNPRGFASRLTNSRYWMATADDQGRATIADLPSRVPLNASVRKSDGSSADAVLARDRVVEPGDETESPGRLESHAGGGQDWSPGEPLVLEPSESRTVAWTISGGVSLCGIVVDQTEQPLARRAIWLRPADAGGSVIFQSHSVIPTRSTSTDEAGRFRFDEVPAGAWHVGPAAQDASQCVPLDDVVPMAHHVDIPDRAPGKIEVRIRVDRGLFIRGRVLTPAGGAPWYAQVAAWTLDRRQVFETRVQDGDGSFELGPLAIGRYRIAASSTQYVDSTWVEVESGSEGVELRLQAGGRIFGRILSRDGELVPGCVMLSSRTSEGARWRGATASEGDFTLGGIEPGTYDLCATTEDERVGFVESIRLAAGDPPSGVDVVVAPGGDVRVRHEGADRSIDVSLFHHGVLVAVDGMEPGVLRTFPAPSGRVLVRAIYRSGTEPVTVDREVDVLPGETVDVIFQKRGP